MVRFLSNASDDKAFLSLIKNIGKQALAHLQFGTNIPTDDDWLTKGLVVECSNGLAFAHGSIEIFLASLYFVLSLQTAEIEDLVRDSTAIFLVDSLFLYFSLALLNEGETFGVQEKEVCYQKLKRHVLDRIDSVQLDLHDIALLYPSLDISGTHIPENDLVLRFVLDAIKSCEETQEPFLVPTVPVAKNQGGNNSKPMVDFAIYAKPNALHIFFDQEGYHCCDIVTRKKIPPCPNLQSLYFGPSVGFGTKSTMAFCEATKNGKFSGLNRIDISCSAPKELVQLFHDSSKLSLKHFTFQGFDLDTEAANTLFPTLSSLEIDQKLPQPLQATFNELVRLRILESGDLKEFAGRCPNLVLLEITSNSNRIVSILRYITLKNLPVLRELNLQAREGSLLVLPENFADNDLVLNLTSLHLTRFTFHGGLSSFFSETESLTKLETLGFVDCNLSAHDIRCLVQANLEGLLPNLKHLDLSRNVSSSKHLFDLNCKWENLTSLNIESKGRYSHGGESFDDFVYLTQKSLSGCLNSLEELRFSTPNPHYVPKVRSPCWPRLKTLQISSNKLSCKEILLPLADLIDTCAVDVLKLLASVTLCVQERKYLSLALEKQKLRRKGIRVYFVTRDM